MAHPVVAIFGPTAAGKSELALRVASETAGEVVSADAMQLYRGLPTLTAQPTAAEAARVPHRLVAIWDLDHAGSVGEYAPLARAAIDACRADGRTAILAGGTGLYLRAALIDLGLPPDVPAAVRARFGRLYDEEGPAVAHELLGRRDAPAAAAIHPNDRRRVVRALELAEVGASLHPPADALWSRDTRHPTRLFTLDWERPALLERIEHRVERMLAGGALREVRAVLENGPEPSPSAARILGLAEVAAHLHGEVTLDECRARIVLRTRQYARRQVIWMRKLPGATTLAGADGAEQNARRVLAQMAP